MKMYFLLGAMMAYNACLLPAQVAPPTFHTKLYVYDSAGHQDSITIGYDFLEPYYHQNAAWGEVLLSTPWDSVFEVRANENSVLFSKTVIGGWEGDCNYGGSPDVFIGVYAKYPPVTFSWNSSLYRTPSDNYQCRQSTYFTNTRAFQSTCPPPPFWHVNLREQDSLVMAQNINTNEDRLMVPIQGGVSDTAGLYYISFRSYDIEMDIYSSEMLYGKVSVYPNPTTGNFSVQVSEIDAPAIEMELLQSDGKTLLRRNISRYEQGDSIDFAPNLASGLYVLRFSVGGYSTVKKLVVQ